MCKTGAGGGRNAAHLKELPGAACRYVANDQRVHILNIGMRFPAEVDANVETLSGDVTYSPADETLLAGVSDYLRDQDWVKKMKVD